MPPSHHASAGRRRSGRGNKAKVVEETGKSSSSDPVYVQPDTAVSPPQQTVAGTPSPSVAREDTRQDDRREADIGLMSHSRVMKHAPTGNEDMENKETTSGLGPSDQPLLPSRPPYPDNVRPSTPTVSFAVTSSHSSQTRYPPSPLASSSFSSSSFGLGSRKKETTISVKTHKATFCTPHVDADVQQREHPLTDISDKSYIFLDDAETQRECADRKYKNSRPETDSSVWAGPGLESHSHSTSSFASGFRNALIPSKRLEHEEGEGVTGAFLRGQRQTLDLPGRDACGTSRGDEGIRVPRERRSNWRRELRALCAVALAFLRACWIWMKHTRLRAATWIGQNATTVRVATYTFLLLVTSTGNTICFKKMIDKMPNYSPCLTQVTTVVFVPVFFALSLYTDYAGGLPREMAEFPKRNFAIMGFLDSFSGVMAIIGAVHTTGTTQVVLQQSCIVFSLLASIIMLGKRFHVAHYLGALVIILGVLVVKLPDLIHPSPDGGDDLFIFNLLYLLSNLPTAVSCVYKEVAFRGVEMGTNYLQAWVALFQFLIGFLVLPLSALPVLGPQTVPLADLPSSLWNGVRCLIGYDTIVTNCGAAGGTQSPCDNCEGAWKYVSLYLSFNLLYNMFIIFVVKNGGAALTFLVSTLRLPVTALAFCSHAIMGDRAVPPKATDFYGLLVLILGLVIYRAGGIMKKRALRRAIAASRRHTSPAVLSPREVEEEYPGTIFVEEVFAAGEIEDADLIDDEEIDEDSSDIEAHPVFTSVIAPEPPQVYVHARHHSHGDNSYHKLPANGSSPAAFTPFTHHESSSGGASCSRQRNCNAFAGETSSRLHAFPFDEETGYARGKGTGEQDSPPVFSVSQNRGGSYEPPAMHVLLTSVVGKPRTSSDKK